LIAIDFDLPGEIEKFLEEHPFAKDSMRTVGAKTWGGQIWFRIIGDYPEKTFTLWANGEETGEFRGGDGQSVVWGLHPEGVRYRFAVDKPLIEISYEQISQWVEARKIRTTPKTPEQEFIEWVNEFHPDLENLDYKRLLTKLNIPYIPKDDDPNRLEMVTCRCFLEVKHTNKNADTDLAFWRGRDSMFPTVECVHTNCGLNDLRAVVEYVDKRWPGLVDACCKAGALPPIKWHDGTEDPELPEEIIEGVLHQGLKMMISGSSKDKKTWLAVNLAISLATGTRWFDFATKKTEVLYLNLEVPERFFIKRLYKICVARNLTEISNFAAMHLRGYDLSHARVWKALIERAARDGPGVNPKGGQV
jgi:hypothetical protein